MAEAVTVVVAHSHSTTLKKLSLVSREIVSSRSRDWPSPRSSARTTTYPFLVQKTGPGVSQAEYFALYSRLTSLNNLAKKL